MKLKIILLILIFYVILFVNFLFSESFGFEYDDYYLNKQNESSYSVFSTFDLKLNKNITKFFVSHNFNRSVNLAFENDYKFFNIFYGNYFLNDRWNRLVFLNKNYLFQVPFQERRNKGIYLEGGNSSFYLGSFYLENHARGIFFISKSLFLLYDFFHKQWGFYLYEIQKLLSIYTNFEGEKKNYQGISSIRLGNKNFNNYLFFMRIYDWDKYHFANDIYFDNKENKYKSFFISNSLNNKIQFLIFRKGDVLYSYYHFKFSLLQNENYEILGGWEYSEIQLTKNKFINKNLLLEFIKDSNKFKLSIQANYDLETFYNLKFSFIFKQQYNSSGIGILYNHYNIEKIYRRFDVFNLVFEYEDQQDFYIQRKDFIFDRGYIGGFLFSRFKLEKINLYLKLFYINKYLSRINKKESMSLYFGSQIFL